MGLGPFDLTGGPFLELYITLFATALVASFLIPPWLRPEGRDGAVRDDASLAWLAGGATRFADAVVARLLAGGALAMTGKTFAVVDPGAARTDAEARALALPSPIAWNDLQSTLHGAADATEHRLLAAGLVMDKATTRQLRFWQTFPLFLLIPFGLAKWEVGHLREKPVGYLTALLIATAVIALIRFVAVNRRTRAGNRALATARADADRLRRAPVSDEVGTAVALFGTAVLAGSPWVAFHQLRTSGSDGGSSGGDGGGCGGGGCGGCGS